MSKKTILLVEDDTVVREVIKDALKKEYNVLGASNYSEAVKLLRHPIDLALIDYILPDSDGFEVLKAIREEKIALPAIIMTGYSNEAVVIKALRSAVADYIKKPIKLSYLRKRLSEILGGEWTNEHTDNAGTKDEFILDGIAAYIEEKYMKELTLDKIANMACMNRFKFCRAFKERFGKTFTSYLNSIRLKKASELLKYPNLTITEIAFFVGYGSFSQFKRVFKKVYGVSPKEYRRSINKKRA
ncbi:MAG: response regulator transcription factor [Nitrospirota bacterium]